MIRGKSSCTNICYACSNLEGFRAFTIVCVKSEEQICDVPGMGGIKDEKNIYSRHYVKSCE
jgi:hypothetical protein